MKWIQVTIFFAGIFGLFVWNRSENKKLRLGGKSKTSDRIFEKNQNNKE